MAEGIKTGGGSRKGKPNKSTAEVRAIMDQVADERAGTKNGKGQKVVFEKLMDLIMGVTVQEIKHGKQVVYTKPPDQFAIKTWLERRWNRPGIAITTMDGDDDQQEGEKRFYIPVFSDGGAPHGVGSFKKRKRTIK